MRWSKIGFNSYGQDGDYDDGMVEEFMATSLPFYMSTMHTLHHGMQDSFNMR